MQTLHGYEVLEKLHARGNKTVLRVRRQCDGLEAVLKYFDTDAQSHLELERIKNEFNRLRAVRSPYVIVVHGLVFFERGVGILMGDFSGESLAGILTRRGPLEPRRFLDVAIKLAIGVRDIHRENVIHRDLKPSNVLVNEATGELKIIDFGISNAFSLTQTFEQMGTLPYMSPEQTGKMNRTVDQRADLYSLGIVLYELLAGRCPFVSNDPLELVHSHIARIPKPVSAIDPSIPSQISAIVQKLLEKEADRRYQSAAGVLADLTLCRSFQERGEEIPSDLPIGAQDERRVFRVPQRLYGRDRELQRLLDTFSRAAAGAFEPVLVAGYSGIGKSALIREIQKPLVAARGFFASGKYDQFNKAKPYSAIQQALDELVRLVLRQPEDEIGRWRELLLEALRGEGQSLVDVVPMLERLLGPQPMLEDAGPVARQKRFNRSCDAILRTFAGADHPLVLFLDDAQWADAASLELIHSWIDREVPYALLILAYRDNEVGANHPLHLMLRDGLKERMEGCRIVLSALEQGHVDELVADTLKREPRDVRDLGEVLFAKTGGNPFFLTQMFAELHRDGLVAFGEKTGWTWDSPAIGGRALTDNVVDLMTQKIHRYPSRTHSALNMCAILGAEFSLGSLASVLETSHEEAYRVILPAISDGLLTEFGGRVQFAHDRIHEAAYGLTTVADRAKRHRLVGRHLLATLDAGGVEKVLFKITEDLNRSADLIESAEERLELVRLNLRAGQKALGSSAFSPSADLFEQAISLLSPQPWSHQPELSYEAYFGLATARYSNAQYEECERSVTTCLTNVTDPVDSAPAVELLVKTYFGQNRYSEGLGIAIERLRALGVDLPAKPSKARVFAAYARLKQLQGSRPTASLVDLPTATDRRAIAAINILNASAPTSFLVNGDLMALMGITMGQLSLRFGNTFFSPFGYCVCMIVEAGLFKAIPSGVEYLDLALAVQDKYPSAQQRAQIELIRACFWHHQVQDLRGWERMTTAAVTHNLDAGIPYFADYALALNRCLSLFFGTRSLDEVYRSNAEVLEVHRKNGDHEVIANQTFVMHTLNRWRAAGGLNEKMDAQVAAFDSAAYDEHHPGNLVAHGQWVVIRQAQHYLDGDYAASLRTGLAFMVKSVELGGVIIDHLHRFFFNLAYLACDHSCLSLKERAKAGAYYHANRALFSVYARHAPNYDSHVALMTAEEHRRAGRAIDALASYERAASDARGISSFNQALAYRRLSTLLASQGLQTQALLVAQEAWRCYQDLAFRSEARRLESEFPGLVTAIEVGASRSLAATKTAGGTASMFTQQLDVESLARGARAISGQVKFEGLVEALLRQLCQSSAAQRAVLLLEEDGKLYVEGEIVVSGQTEDLRLLLRKPFPARRGDAPTIAETVVQFVARIRRTEVQGDTSLGDFAQDPYVKEHSLKSVLCMPILNQGKLLGVLYLENALVSHAFTTVHLQALEILASQAAISFENAHLYRKLEQKVEERTVELRRKTNDLNGMLQNLEQGVFTILKGGAIHREYSRHLESMLGTCAIAGRSYADVIFAEATLSSDALSQTKAAVNLSLGSQVLWYESNRHLLVREMRRRRPDGSVRLLELTWSPILADQDVVEKLLVSVKDVTELRALEQQAQAQRLDLEVIGQILGIPKGYFLAFLEDAEELLTRSERRLANGSLDLSGLADLFRNMHTIKGNASTHAFRRLAQLAHEAEETYAACRKEAGEAWDLERMQGELGEVRDCLDRYRRVYEQNLESFGRGLSDTTAVDNLLLERIRRAVETKSSELPGLIEAIGTSPLEEIVASVGSCLKSAASELHKPTPEVRVTSEGVRFRSELLPPLRDTLVHLFRNAIDHGIEPVAERKSSGKPDAGAIAIHARACTEGCEILISDDGRGLAVDALRAVAAEQALPLESDAQLAELVFVPGLSTVKAVSYTSGRGVGMDAVRRFIADLGGKVQLMFASESPDPYRPFTTRIVLPHECVVYLQGEAGRGGTLNNPLSYAPGPAS